MLPEAGSVIPSVPTTVPAIWFSATVALDKAGTFGTSVTLIVNTWSMVTSAWLVLRTRML